MFDKDMFSELLIKARGDRNNKEYAEISNVSRAYVSGYINKSIENPPTPDVIKRLASKADNGVTYDELMQAAGHIDSSLIVFKDEHGNDLLDKVIVNSLSDSDNKEFSVIMEKALKDSGFYQENMSHEEKLLLAKKVVKFLKVLQDE